ncbi:GDP-4-dehydro-6-deoxy-D-mannose reductase [Novosphingobium sp. PhB165]|uniref:NAD-dependent epimerase/dehydratase family protein n=1 Tax=Novosphingobium sp. PhB165 TaxID=2485105 RepID=UPI0010DA9F18|nr:NAD(P)-dependent oxidoreductase [Novosphingobium sp. PhB165]TCM18690.1 GDP-4-dehydro-6-deoxy-D-mannose reductase [Novosphingobium sp. PhB165]
MASKPGLLVTGASGFVGRHVVAQGRERFDIVATGRGSRPDWLPADVAWRTVDLLNRTSVADLPDDFPYVLHLASETVPSKFSTYDPLLDSVEMTLNLCRHLRSGRLLFASSCLIYAASSQPMTEEAPLDPRGHYGLTKQLCEAIVSRAASEGIIETAIARPFNHIGTGMRPDLVIPSIVRRVQDAEDGASILMAGLDSVRDFLDVEDIVEAYFAILGISPTQDRIFNVSSGVATSIGDVVRTVARVLGKPIGEVVFADRGNSADDTSIVVGDASKLRTLTNWAPQIGLEESLQKLTLSASAH